MNRVVDINASKNKVLLQNAPGVFIKDFTQVAIMVEVNVHPKVHGDNIFCLSLLVPLV